MSAVLDGGGYVESFAFGGPAPQEPPSQGRVSLAPPKSPFSLAMASGASSSAFAATPAENPAEMVKNLHGLGWLGGEFKELLIKILCKGPIQLDPEAEYWPVTEETASETGYLFGDGGNLENYGLIPLLRRRVEKILVFVNTATKLNQDFDPASRPAVETDLDSYLPPLFGFAIDSSGTNTSRNLVFEKEAFAPLVEKLQAAKKAGDAVTATDSFRVADNAWWGIEGGWDVEICWVYLDRAGRWEDLLGGEWGG